MTSHWLHQLTNETIAAKQFNDGGVDMPEQRNRRTSKSIAISCRPINSQARRLASFANVLHENCCLLGFPVRNNNAMQQLTCIELYQWQLVLFVLFAVFVSSSAATFRDSLIEANHSISWLNCLVRDIIWQDGFRKSRYRRGKLQAFSVSVSTPHNPWPMPQPLRQD